MKKFLDCISIVGATPSKFHGTKKYISTGAVATTEIDESEVVEVTYEDRPSRANLSAEAGDILFAKMQGTRKNLLLDSETEKNIYSTGFYAIRANPEVITTECLYYLIDSELFLAQKDKNCSGATQKAITNGGMAKIEISVPPLSEQGILVDKLKHLTQLIADKKKQLNLFDEIIKSRFIEMFGSISDDKKVSMSDVCLVITDGTHQPPKFTSSGIPFLFVSNIVGNEITYDAEKYISEETYAQLIKRTPIEIGDVLLSTVGSYGHPAVVKSNKPFCFQRHIAYLKPKTQLIDSCYLHGAILSLDVQKQIEGRVKGIAQKTLNLSEIRKLRLPLPAIVEQKQFAAFVEQVDKSKFEIQQSLEKLEILKKSLMQQYFG